MKILEGRIFLSPLEARLILNVSKSYVYRLISEKRLKATAERPVRIYTESMEAHLRSLEPRT